MKFIVVVLLTALLGYAAPLYFTWWSFAVCSFIVALFIHQKPFIAFVATFLGLFLLWGIMAMIIDNANNHLLSQKVAQVLPLNGSSILLILITALIGGLVSGFAGLAGSLVRKYNS
ncbi:MAG: hypothetical protein ABJB05_15825 [Parafilimonas sp.]